MSTPLSDPDNVLMVPVEDGFTDDEVQRILNGEPLIASATAGLIAASDYDESKHKRDTRGRFAKKAGGTADAVVASVAFEANTDKYDGGGMVALIPSDHDLDRLALDGEEPRDDLHLTLWYLGDNELTDVQKEDVLREVAHYVDEYWDKGPIQANAFGVAQWNSTSDKPAWVLNVGDANEPQLTRFRAEIGSGIAQDFVLPPQHTPWQSHICIAYSSDDLLNELTQRLGPVTFDKVRVAYGRDNYDIELEEPSLTAAGDFIEAEHPRDNKGKFSKHTGGSLSAYSNGFKVDKELGGGNSGSKTELLTLSDGSRVVRKTGGQRRDEKDPTTRREYLGGLIFNALGNDSIHTEQVDDNTIITNYVEGESGASLVERAHKGVSDWATKKQKINDEYERQVQLPGGKEIAVLDYLGKNMDRHGYNWVVSGNRVTPLDQGELDFNRDFVDFNGQKIEEGTTSVFTKHWLGVKGAMMNTMKPKITKDEVATYRRNIESLRSEFNQGDEPKWFNDIMGRLDFLESKVS